VANIIGRPYLDWDTREGEEFTEKGPNFLNYVEHMLPERGENCFSED